MLISRFASFLKTTAIGGLLFLLPIVVIGALLGYLYKIIASFYEPLKKFIPVDTAVGIAGLFLLAVAVVTVLCFFCGLLTRRAFARKFTQTIERQLVTVFPKYAIYKDLLAGNIGGAENRPTLVPVTVQLNDLTRIAFETERLVDGRVVVYLPGAPDTWAGSVALVSPDQVTSLNVPLSEVVGIFEKLGRECAPLFAKETLRTIRS